MTGSLADNKNKNKNAIRACMPIISLSPKVFLSRVTAMIGSFGRQQKQNAIHACMTIISLPPKVFVS